MRGILLLCVLYLTHGLLAHSVTATSLEHVSARLLVVGGTESGWAAAVQAARMGLSDIVIVHDGHWLGGQFTEQALACVDENKGVGNVGWGVDWHPMKRSFHRSGLFKELMDQIEAFNESKYGSPMPGRPWHGPSTFRPAEAEAVFRQILQPYIDAGQVRLIENHRVVRADVDATGEGSRQRRRLKGLWFAPTDQEQTDLHVTATLTIDASDWGDVIQASGTEFECGPDPPSRYGEPSAPEIAPHNEMNPITWAMIIEQSDHDTPIDRPDHFDDRNYPRATRFSLNAFGDLRWDVKNPGMGAIQHWPDTGEEASRQLSVYSVRRIVEGTHSKDGTTAILLNYMNGQDYPLERLPQHVCDALERDQPGASQKNIVEMSRQQRQIIFDDAKQHALGVLYHMQNFVHERAKDKGNSLRGFHLSDEFGTEDKLPPKPYIRESLRLKAMYMMREQDGRNRDGFTKSKARPRFASVMYPDGLFAWQFHYDFHRTGRTYLTSEGAKGPWIDYHKPLRHTSFLSDRSVFPLRSLVPLSTEGLLGAQGNLGFSSIVSAALRLHDQRIAIGQAAGAVAAVSLNSETSPREFPYQRELLESVRQALCGNTPGATPLLIWPFRDLPCDHPAFEAVNRLAALGVLPMKTREVDFRADATAADDWITQACHRAKVPVPDQWQGSRGEFCLWLWQQVRSDLGRRFPINRMSQTDADGDGIVDIEDALLFTANDPITFEIETIPQPPSRDGVPDQSAEGWSQAFDFGGAPTPLATGFRRDWGAAFDSGRGYGWRRDIHANHRQRNRMTVPGDTFLFTRETDHWQCQLPTGRYHVTVCVGDAAHEQSDQYVAVEGVTLIDHENTAEGEFCERTRVVDVNDGMLDLTMGSGTEGSNTCLNWLLLRPIAVQPAAAR